MHAEIVELFLILLYFVPIFSLQPEHSHKKRISAHLYPSSATGRDLEQQAQLLYVIRDSPIIHGDAVALRVSRTERRYRRGLHDGPRSSAAVNSPDDAMLADSRVDRAIFMNCVYLTRCNYIQHEDACSRRSLGEIYETEPRLIEVIYS